MKKPPKSVKIDPNSLKEGWAIKTKVLTLCQSLDASRSSKAPNKEFKNCAEEIISKNGVIKDVGLSWLLKKKVFGKMAPADVFDIATSRLEANDASSLEKILQATQKHSPFHTELGLHKTKSGETLGHLAARLDRPEILIKIGKLNPQYLRQKDNTGDTPLHTASRYLSLKSIKAAIKNFPALFALRNDVGQMPKDLEAGSYIRKKITDQEISSAHNKEKDTYQKALLKLRSACKEQKYKKSKSTRVEKTHKKGVSKPSTDQYSMSQN